MKGNALVGQSGGPTSVINASLAGVIEKCLQSNEIETVYGAVNGIEGVVNGNLTVLNDTFSDPKNIECLKTSPSAYLGSCRFKLPKEFCETHEKIFEVFEKYNIKYFFYIGGNDSMDTVYRLSELAKAKNYDVKIMGIPKTIDNDLFGTDHCPGFGSAAKYVATSILEVALDMSVYPTDSVVIMEVMGRNAGWLTAAAALAKTSYSSAPQLIYLPEKPFTIEQFLSDLERVRKTEKHIVVAVSEGVRDKDGVYLCESVSKGVTDSFGHTQLSGVAGILEDAVREKFGCRTRAIEFSLLQRCASHCSSLTDVTEAATIGAAGVEAALKGETGKMMAFVRKSESPYTIAIESRNISEIANVEKFVPDNFITPDNCGITQEFIDYALPLIQGETPRAMKDGLPVYMKLK